MIFILIFLIADISLLVLSIYFVIKLNWLFLLLSIVGLLLSLSLTGVFLFSYSTWRRSVTFWKFARKKPEEFLNLFRARESIWKVFDSELSKKIFDTLEKSKNNNEWIGPFMLKIPKTKKIVYIYGKDGLYQKEQDEMIRILTNPKI